MNPYQELPSSAFWSSAVAERSMFEIQGLWDPKFDILPSDQVATFGSCFAQNIGRALREHGLNWLVTERAPLRCSRDLARKYNYGVFSARTGNIYTTSLLNQWVSWAIDNQPVPGEVWQRNGAFFDPFRPRIEPSGFESVSELQESRAQAIESFRESIRQADYLVFTLGLTESWFNIQHGYEYPMCPGTAGGIFEKTKHQFVNQRFQGVRDHLVQAMRTMNELNPELKFILTVSPVSLAATKSGQHVAVATMGTKSTLRAVAEDLSAHHSNIDYFPSYEIINSPVFRGVFLQPNQRHVSPHGVDFVMKHFIDGLSVKFGNVDRAPPPGHTDETRSDVDDEDCDEGILQQFA